MSRQKCLSPLPERILSLPREGEETGEGGVREEPPHRSLSPKGGEEHRGLKIGKNFGSGLAARYSLWSSQSTPEATMDPLVLLGGLAVVIGFIGLTVLYLKKKKGHRGP